MAGCIGGLKLLPDIFSELLLGAAQCHAISIQAHADA